MITRSELESRVGVFLQSEIDRILNTVPYAAHLISDEQVLNEEYYLRHRIETIKRIRLTGRIDALALARMIEEDYASSRLWGHYVAEELTHDILYKRDLYQHGYSDKDIDDTPLLDATCDLIAYLTRRIEEIGSLAAVAYSLFVEWNSDRVSERVVTRAQRCFSAKHVSGSQGHVNIDKKARHYSMILDIAYRLVERIGSECELLTTLEDLARLFSAYFRELYDVTVGRWMAGEIPNHALFSERL